MSFKANIDIFVNFSFVRVRFLNRQGYLRYRMHIYYVKEGEQISFQPYNIVKGAIKSNNLLDDGENEIDSQIDTDAQCYYSKLISIRYRPDEYHQNETVFFKSYINTEEIEKNQFYCKIQCLFSQNPKEKFEVVGNFKAQIRKIFGISTYLPVTFDAFEGFMISSTFHSTIMEFKYEESNQQNLPLSKSVDKKYYDFWSYIDSITDHFVREKIVKFYTYYRNFLENQHKVLQNRYQLLFEYVKKLNKEQSLKSIKQLSNDNFPFQHVRVMKNKELIRLLEGKANNFFTSSKSVVDNIEEQEKILDQILKDFCVVKGLVYEKWMDFANFVTNNSIRIANYYMKEYQGLCRDRFKHNVFSHKIKSHDWRMSKYFDSGKINLEHAFMEKKKTIAEEQLWMEHFPIQNCSYFYKCENNIKFFEEIYLTNSKISIDGKGKHIVVLVHGFQASRSDFILFKNCLEVIYGLQVIISTCNEGLTDHSILMAGKRLGNELSKLMASVNSTKYRISFIGHSMGGLIIRAAIPYLTHLSDRFYSFISLSSPHLGYLYQSGALIRAGLWLLNTVQKCQSITQLSLKDNENLRLTTLYKLSQNSSLNNFKHLCFLCSSLDEYVVYESARVEINEQLVKNTLDTNSQTVINEMVTGILGKVKSPQISRINVVFDIQDKSLDSFLGRTGHVKFLSDLQFIREFCACFDKYFI